MLLLRCRPTIPFFGLSTDGMTASPARRRLRSTSCRVEHCLLARDIALLVYLRFWARHSNIGLKLA